MAKRFTDTMKWEDMWFRKLESKYKLFWIYVCDKCDNAGVWQPDFELASLLVGSQLNEAECLEKLNQGKVRIKPLPDGLWHIPGFLEFQFGTLAGGDTFHKSLRKLVGKYASRGLEAGFELAKDKDKDKDKDKYRGGVGGEGIEIPQDLLEHKAEIDLWLTHKREKGQTYKKTSILMLWSRLRKIPQDKRKEAIELSISNNYAGIFEPNRYNNATNRIGAEVIKDKYKNAGKC